MGHAKQHETVDDRWCRVYCARLSLRRPGELKEGAICLCRCLTLPSESQAASFLTDDERLYYGRVSSETRKRGFLMGRLAARQALSRVTAPKSERARIRYGVFNNPLVNEISTSGDQVDLSITHAGELGAALVFPSCHQMGIDLEKVNPDKTRVIEREMTLKELALLGSSGLEHDAMLTAAWTIKESIAKSLKTGLTTPFTIFEISEMTERGAAIESSFSNFHQYKAMSFRIMDYFLSVSLPKKTEILIDVEGIRERLF